MYGQFTHCKTIAISWNYIKRRSKWVILVNDIASKLIGKNAILSKLRHFAAAKAFESIYFVILYSLINNAYILHGTLQIPHNKEYNLSIEKH